MKFDWNKEYGKKDKVTPVSYSMRTPLNMSIHHHIYYDKDEWLFTCRDFDIMARQLDTKDIDEAEEKALDIIKNYVDDINRKYNELVNGGAAT